MDIWFHIDVCRDLFPPLSAIRLCHVIASLCSVVSFFVSSSSVFPRSPPCYYRRRDCIYLDDASQAQIGDSDGLQHRHSIDATFSTLPGASTPGRWRVGGVHIRSGKGVMSLKSGSAGTKFKQRVLRAVMSRTATRQASEAIPVVCGDMNLGLHEVLGVLEDGPGDAQDYATVGGTGPRATKGGGQAAAMQLACCCHAHGNCMATAWQLHGSSSSSPSSPSTSSSSPSSYAI